jgi:hypothetical protein
VGVQEVRWEGGGIESTSEYTFFCRKGSENHELGKRFFVFCITGFLDFVHVQNAEH